MFDFPPQSFAKGSDPVARATCSGHHPPARPPGQGSRWCAGGVCGIAQPLTPRGGGGRRFASFQSIGGQWKVSRTPPEGGHPMSTEPDMSVAAMRRRSAWVRASIPVILALGAITAAAIEMLTVVRSSQGTACGSVWSHGENYLDGAGAAAIPSSQGGDRRFAQCRAFRRGCRQIRTICGVEGVQTTAMSLGSLVSTTTSPDDTD